MLLVHVSLLYFQSTKPKKSKQHQKKQKKKRSRPRYEQRYDEDNGEQGWQELNEIDAGFEQYWNEHGDTLVWDEWIKKYPQYLDVAGLNLVAQEVEIQTEQNNQLNEDEIVENSKETVRTEHIEDFSKIGGEFGVEQTKRHIRIENITTNGISDSEATDADVAANNLELSVVEEDRKTRMDKAIEATLKQLKEMDMASVIAVTTIELMKYLPMFPVFQAAV